MYAMRSGSFARIRAGRLWEWINWRREGREGECEWGGRGSVNGEGGEEGTNKREGEEGGREEWKCSICMDIVGAGGAEN